MFGIFAPDESEVLGGTGLHTRAGDGGARDRLLGAGRPDAAGNRDLVAGALTKVGIELGRCRPDRDPGRGRQRAERHGSHGGWAFARRAVLRRRLPPAGGGLRRDALVFTLLAEELDGSPAAGIGFAAFDCRGQPVA